MSVFDDGEDIGTPAAESRGGEHPDWERAKPGQELPELPVPQIELPPEEKGGDR